MPHPDPKTAEELLEQLRFKPDDLEGILVQFISKEALRLAKAMARAARKLVNSYRGPRAFEQDWKWLRLAVPLQVRLVVEQVLWDKRGGYRDLVTGFGPVRGRNKK